jgi:dolichyl-phosphate-mannose--protein O-mannosyl transferase
MQTGRSRQSDPIAWCAFVALAFFFIALHRLGLPNKLYFDEIHYVPAARKLLLEVPANREHPLFAKEVIAASIAMFGDSPLSWRLPSLLFGTFGLFAFGRLLWLTSGMRFATIAGMTLLASNFTWFVQSRIAMLDIFAASLAMTALWQFAGAIRENAARPRLHLALSGILLGLSLASKWSAAPIALGMGLAYFLLTRRKPGASRPAIPLVEAAFWIGLLPLAVYWTTYAPDFFLAAKDRPISPFGFIEQHRKMIALQGSVTKAHSYQSLWYQWVLNLRPVWFLYREIDGAQRGVLLLGNPFTMIAGLAAAIWCLWAGFARKRRGGLAFVALWAVSLSLWLVSGKPVQFYYHYLLPGAFLMGCLALALQAMVEKGGKWRAAGFSGLLASLAMFAFFHPILSAADLHEGKQAFHRWTWLASWV